HLFTHCDDMRVAAEDNRGQEIRARRRAAQGLAEKAVTAGMRQKLFRKVAARFWPEPCSGAAAKDNGLNHQRHAEGLSASKAPVTRYRRTRAGGKIACPDDAARGAGVPSMP